MSGFGRMSAYGLASSPRVAIAVAAVLAVAAIVARESQPLALAVQLMCCVGAGVAVVRPLVGSVILGIILLVVTLAQPTLYLGIASFAFPIAITSCAARGHRLAGLAAGLWYFALFTAVEAANLESARELAENVNVLLVVMFAPLLLGELVWRVQRRSEHQRRAQKLEAERQRQSIARDLHDTLAYATTVMVMKAEQARLRGGQDDQTLADLDFIAATGRSTTADLRTILAMLRESERTPETSPTRRPQLGTAEPTRLTEVVEAQRAKLAAFDFEANLAVNGDPKDVPDRLTAVLARGLTEMASNITKHGDPCSEVSIMIDIGPDDVELVAINAPRPTPAESGHRGLGLLGLREVVEAVGGALHSDRMGDRWITHLTLPLRGGHRV